jgi:hypothetical protein
MSRKYERIAFLANPMPEARKAFARLVRRYGNVPLAKADVVVALGGSRAISIARLSADFQARGGAECQSGPAPEAGSLGCRPVCWPAEALAIRPSTGSSCQDAVAGDRR